MRLAMVVFALLFLLPLYVAVEALLKARRRSSFDIKGMTISKEDAPVAYRVYYTLFLVLIPVFAALSVGLAAVAFADPWGN